MSVLSERNAEFVRLLAPETDEILEEIESENRERGFPMVGPEVGGVLRVVARLVGATRVFEFGSGLGYSAYWFAGALPSDGTVVLTEVDEDELETAREFFAAGGIADRARFELGDAHDVFERYDGPFDVVLLDHEKERYAEAFEAVKPKLADCGAVIADNTMGGGSIELDDLLAVLDGESPDLDSMTEGIAAYLETVRDDPDVETIALPVGEGITVSVKR